MRVGSGWERHRVAAFLAADEGNEVVRKVCIELWTTTKMDGAVNAPDKETKLAGGVALQCLVISGTRQMI